MNRKLMTETIKYNNWSGKLTDEDFSTHSPNVNRLSNQHNADKLYKEILESKQKIRKLKKYMRMSCEELRAMKIIQNTDGRPDYDLTDEKWQMEFILRKTFVKPFKKETGITKMGGRYSRKASSWNEETHGEYHGDTGWQNYCWYINDVLSEIRLGNVDYCYYIYQILDLLKFHYDDLCTRYCDGYWEVWLKNYNFDNLYGTNGD